MHCVIYSVSIKTNPSPTLESGLISSRMRKKRLVNVKCEIRMRQVERQRVEREIERQTERDWLMFSSVQFSHSCPTLCDPMNHSTPGLPIHHQLTKFTQTHVHQDGDAIQPSHPLLSPSPPAPNPSQYQGLFQWVNSSYEVGKVLEFQLQHQSFQWTPRSDLP